MGGIPRPEPAPEPHAPSGVSPSIDSEGEIRMTEERITRVDTPEGNTHVRTEVIRDAEPRRSGGLGVMLLVVLVIALLVGGFVLMQGQNAEIAKDNAVADAAGSVGNAAESIGNAADQAAEKIAN